jgi:hypothetical protein
MDSPKSSCAAERYTPPHLRSPDQKKRSNPDGSPLSTNSSTPWGSPHSPQKSSAGTLKLSAAGSPLWADITDDDNLPHPLTHTDMAIGYGSKPKTLSQDSFRSPATSHNFIIDRIVPRDTSYKPTATLFGAETRSQASSCSNWRRADTPQQSNHSVQSYEDTYDSQQIHPDILGKLENFHISAHYTKLVSTINQRPTPPNTSWDEEPHITIEMDETETGEYIQDLLDTALIFYFNNRPPSFLF